MTPADASLDLVANMLLELEQYLLSPELFWPLHPQNSPAPQARLTLGNLLLSLDQLLAMRPGWDVPTESRFLKISHLWAQAQVKWQSAIQRKAAQELSSRMNLWGAYVYDLEDGQGAKFDFRHEIRHRVIIERLFDLGLPRDRWEKELQQLDQRSQKLVDKHDFVWSQPLQTQYPHQQYWFLYRMSRSAGPD
jgi:hypothetical protein